MKAMEACKQRTRNENYRRMRNEMKKVKINPRRLDHGISKTWTLLFKIHKEQGTTLKRKP
jgi:hypothetical protein